MVSTAQADLLMTLLTSAPPSAWSEDKFIQSPLYRVEQFDEKLLLLPDRSEAELVLENLVRMLGLRKNKTTHPSYLIQKSECFKAFRNFLWLIRRSWRNEEVRIIWSALYVANAKGWGSVPLNLVAEVSGSEHARCREVLAKVLDGEKLVNSETLKAERKHFSKALDHLVESIPTWSEELVMATLCSETYASVEDIFLKVRPYGLSIGAVYKIVQRLKKANQIVRVRYSRRSLQGPMREVFSPNCRSCFYGYSSEEKCLQHLLVEMEMYFRGNYGRELSSEEKEVLYKSLRLTPFGSRLLRKLMSTFRLVRSVEMLMRDERLAALLRKLDELCGIKMTVPSFEFKTRNNIGDNPLN
ncbi:MAG: hypothetical protein QW544_05530 [Candidatus Caldarchaeum sp.]